MDAQSTFSDDASRDMYGQPPLKRSRSVARESTDAMNIDVPSPSASGSVEFVEAKEGNTESSSDLVARLNFSAADERRKALLQRLRAIDAKKAELGALQIIQKDAPSPAPSSDSVVFVEEKHATRSRYPLSASPTDVQDVIISPPVPRAQRKRKARPPPPRRKPARGKKQPTVQIIDVDAEPSADSRVLSKPPRAKKPSCAKVADSAAPKRTSSRVRRPRTPNADPTLANDAQPLPTPTCMSKCKRFQFCKKLISSMIRDSSAGPFSAPVKELWAPGAIPRYFDVITNPMDLRTVKKRLETSAYVTPSKDGPLAYFFEVDSFASDVCLVFRNAMVYNRRGDMLFNCAKALMEDFEKTLREQLPPIPEPADVQTVAKKRPVSRKGRKDKPTNSYRSRSVDKSDLNVSEGPASNQVAPATAKAGRSESWMVAVSEKDESEASEVGSQSLEDMEERLKYLRRCRPAVLSRTPVPKGSGYLSRAALLYGVEIPYEQKKRCSNVIQSGKVPRSKVEGLVALVKKSTGDKSGGDVADDEFEFEFDKLDNRAWRNMEAFLEQFVPGFKTIRSSILGREFSSVEAVDSEIASIEKRLEGQETESKKKVTCVASKPRSFFGGDDEDGESSSDSSDDDSDSECSDSESDEE